MKNREQYSQKKRYFVGGLFMAALFALLLVGGRDAASRDDGEAPRTPQGFSVELDGNEAALSWNENTEWDIFSYVVAIRSSAQKEPGIFKLTGLRESYSLSDLEPGERYFLSIAARDNSGNVSPLTEEIGFLVPREEELTFGVHAWIPATADQLDSVVSFEKNREQFKSISPFVYALEEDGSISQRGDVLSTEVFERAKAEGVLVIPSITNNFDRGDTGTNVLLDNERRDLLVNTLIGLVDQNNFDGVDIDFENINTEARDQFSIFIEQLGVELRKRDKRLVVTLQPKESDSQDWSGVGSQDFEIIGRHADEVRIMTYDHARVNTPPGPIAPIGWYENVLRYAVSKIPAEKVVAGVPFYAYRWCTEQKGEACPTDGLVWAGVRNIVEKYDPEIKWDPDNKSAWFEYTDEQENRYIVHFENYQSLEAKLEVVEQLGLPGVAIWRLGNEDPKNFEVLARYATTENVSLPRIAVQPKDEEIEIAFLDVDALSQSYRISYSSKNSPERFVDVRGESSYVIPGLINEEQYEITIAPRKQSDVSEALFSEDLALESEYADVKHQLIATPQDLAYPAAVADVKVEDVGVDSVSLSFTASGDEFLQGMVDHYEIRYSEEPITIENINQAELYENPPRPLPPGERHYWQIRNLKGGARYYFSIRAFDEVGNASDMSNMVEAQTVDIVAPKIPEISSIISGDGEAEIIWKANQEEDIAGYNVFFKTDNGAYNVVRLSKLKNHLVIPQLENNRRYYIALSAIDVHGNESTRSQDFEVVPRSSNALTRFSEEVLADKEKIRGSLYLFAERFANERALPYLAMIGVVIVNIFIYYSFKGEILRLVARKEEVLPPMPQKRTRMISDMK